MSYNIFHVYKIPFILLKFYLTFTIPKETQNDTLYYQVWNIIVGP